MSVASLVVVFTTAWMIVFFMTLPLWVEREEHTEKGFAKSAPKNPRLLLKVTLTTSIATILTIIYFYLLQTGFFSRIDVGF